MTTLIIPKQEATANSVWTKPLYVFKAHLQMPVCFVLDLAAGSRARFLGSMREARSENLGDV